MESENINEIFIYSESSQPTAEEKDKVSELKLLIKEHLVHNSSLDEPVRQAVAKYGTDQELLLKFVRGRKQNLKKALDSIIRYADVRLRSYPEMFPEEMPEYVKYAMDSGIINVLKNKDKLGRTIILFRATNWKVSEICLEEIICAGRYLTEGLMNIPEFLTKGVILLTDCDGATLSHAKHFTISAIAKFVNVFWLAFPIQIKGLYYVNSPMFVRPVYAVVKPFLPPKLRERILITSGVTDLHKKIDREILPESVGGELPDDDALSFDFLQKVRNGLNPTNAL